MKKYIVSLFIFGLFFLGAGSAKAVSMSDLQKEIKSLSEQIVGLKSQILGQVISSRTATVPAISVDPIETVLTKGVKSTEVAQVQTALRNQGYSIVADGSFGAKTEAAVRAFQIAKSLPVTGRVDSLTRSKLVNPPTPTPACDPNADGAPWIKITSPNGGETFTAGQQITVTWESCNLSASEKLNVAVFNSNLNVNLVDDFDFFLFPITTTNTGSVTMIIPNLNNGSTQTFPAHPGQAIYKVRVQKQKDDSVKDYSDNNFTINNNSSSTFPAGCSSNSGYSLTTGKTCASGSNLISYWYGKVNQHISTSGSTKGSWITDPDGVSGANLDMLTYCKKWYPNTTSVVPLMNQTLTNWQDRGNVSQYTSVNMAYQCVESTSTCGPNDPPSIQLVSPFATASYHGGYTKGQSFPVTWKTCNISSNARIHIGLIDADGYTIQTQFEAFLTDKYGTINDGSETFIIPSGLMSSSTKSRIVIMAIVPKSSNAMPYISKDSILSDFSLGYGGFDF